MQGRRRESETAVDVEREVDPLRAVSGTWSITPRLSCELRSELPCE